jgi:hypothetical protein
MKKLASITAPEKVEPVARQIEARERHVGRADLERHEVVAEGADGQRHHPQEHHDGAVHGAELVVELGQHDAARGVGRAEQAADERHGRPRVGELPPDDDDQRESDQQEKKAGEPVQKADHLVIGRIEVPEEQLLRIL